jgi:hypothetical protein
MLDLNNLGSFHSTSRHVVFLEIWSCSRNSVDSFQQKCVYAFLRKVLTCSPQLMLPDLITLIILDGEYNLRSTSLCVPNSLLPVTSSSFGLPQLSLLSAVGIATGYGLGDRGVGLRVAVGSRIVSSPRHPDRLWSPPSLLSNGYWGLFPRE